MSRIAWWVADKLALLLETRERAVVKGDLSELGATGLQAAWEILGFIVRRQADLWRKWEPWVALLLVVIPAGWLLSTQAAYFSHSVARTLVNIFVDHPGPGARNLQSSHYLALFIRAFQISTWAAACGFVIGVLSWRALWIHSVFWICAWFATLVALQLTSLPGTYWSSDGTEFPPALYRLGAPIAIQAVLVFFPLAIGLARGFWAGDMRLREKILLLTPFYFLALEITQSLRRLRPDEPVLGAVAWTPVPIWPVLVALTIVCFLSLRRHDAAAPDQRGAS